MRPRGRRRGVSYILVACILGITFACGSAMVIEAFVHLAAETQYEKEGRDDEAAREEEKARKSFFRLLWLCPCATLVMLGGALILGMWIWGIIEAVEASLSGTNCGSGPAAFWIMLLVAIVMKYCGVQLCVFCGP